MAVTLQLSKPESLRRTIIAETDSLVNWNWLQWFTLIWRVLNYVKIGTDTPLNKVSAPVGTIFLRLDGGANTTLYVKESGTDATGWIGK